MKDLAQPLRTWLSQSHLTPESNGHCLLFVDSRSIEFIKDLSNFSQVYSIVKSMHKDMLSLHLLSLPVKKLVESNLISFYSVEQIQ